MPITEVGFAAGFGAQSQEGQAATISTLEAQSIPVAE